MKFAAKTLLLVSLAATFASAQTLPHFQHIIIVIQENRTPDDLFGANLTFENGVDLAGGGYGIFIQNGNTYPRVHPEHPEGLERLRPEQLKSELRQPRPRAHRLDHGL